jgi:hypothetical protein
VTVAPDSALVSRPHPRSRTVDGVWVMAVPGRVHVVWTEGFQPSVSQAKMA